MIRSPATLLATCLCIAACDTLAVRDGATPADPITRGSVPVDCVKNSLAGGGPRLQCLDSPTMNKGGIDGGGGSREIRRQEETKT